ncbi:CBS domain-containing protein [Candidatus Leptofilum sp.]|uniref:CBS domain-containing protein n=1 Tax=Candidatus Leptofilum sp. TaxID=3241576 RepID=UPI003B597D98
MLTTSDLMTIDPETVTQDTPLRTIVTTMNQANIRQVLVIDGKKLVGIVTDRDIRLAVNSPLTSEEPLERLELLNDYKAADCMTVNPRTVSPDTPIHKVAQLLSVYKFGALPVVENDELVGIITITDLLNQMALLPEPKSD